MIFVLTAREKKPGELRTPYFFTQQQQRVAKKLMVGVSKRISNPPFQKKIQKVENLGTASQLCKPRRFSSSTYE
jgi:hypothetical protein